MSNNNIKIKGTLYRFAGDELISIPFDSQPELREVFRLSNDRGHTSVGQYLVHKLGEMVLVRISEAVNSQTDGKEIDPMDYQDTDNAPDCPNGHGPMERSRHKGHYCQHCKMRHNDRGFFQARSVQ